MNDSRRRHNGRREGRDIQKAYKVEPIVRIHCSGAMHVINLIGRPDRANEKHCCDQTL